MTPPDNTSDDTQIDTKVVHENAHETTLTESTEPAFHRVLVRRAGAMKHSTVSISQIDYKKLMHFAYGNATLLHSALREAALRVELPPATASYAEAITGMTKKRQDFSAAVRSKALKSLQGSYRPEVAARLSLTAEEKVAAENNAAWAGAAGPTALTSRLPGADE